MGGLKKKIKNKKAVELKSCAKDLLDSVHFQSNFILSRV